PGEAAALEEDWSRVSRVDDYEAWADRPGGRLFTVRLGGRPVGVGAAARPGRPGRWVLEHLGTDPGLVDALAAETVRVALATLAPAATVHLPAPHHAVRFLLAAGWRVTTYDLFMATDADLLDPERVVPSPALA
ncbi:MAG: hypothetical protein QOK15_1549, partial [Nocardioidaceae bacterium]|nr:hypothetical protein [Nocardioidaceae bacterium]